MQNNKKTKKLRVQIVCCASKKKRSDGDPNSTEEFRRSNFTNTRETVHCHYGSSPFVKGSHRCAYEFKHKQQKIAQRKNCSLGLPPRTTSQRKRLDAEVDENSDWRVSEHEASKTSALTLGESVYNIYDVRVNIGALRERLKASGRSSFAN